MDGETKVVLLEELRRQDALIHSVSAELAKKTGLYMAFSGFVFTGAVAFFAAIEKIGMTVPASLLLTAMLCSLGCIYKIVQASRLENYVTPPLGQNLIEQTEERLARLIRLDRSTKNFAAKVKGGLVISLARSVRKNYLRNQDVAGRLHAAFLWLSAALVTVFLAAAWVPLVRVVAFLVSALRV